MSSMYEQLATTENPPNEAEKLIIRDLFSDPAFARFYQDNRHHITDPVYWLYDPTLPPGVFAAASMQLPTLPECHMVHVPHVPARTNEGFPVAHELSHILLWQEGYPGVNGDGQVKNLAMILGSLVTDLVIDRRLADNYGFVLDARPEVKKTFIVGQLRGQLTPANPIHRIHWIISCLDIILDYEMITGNTSPHPLYEWFALHHPNLTRHVDKLLHKVHDVGYETPQQQEQLLRYIIQKYNLPLFGIRLNTQQDRQRLRAKFAPHIQTSTEIDATERPSLAEFERLYSQLLFRPN